MATVDALGISEDQKNQVRNLIETATRNAEAAAVEQARVDFRAGVAGTRRPEVFDPVKTSITAYFECFEPFRRVVGLKDANAVQSFQTYLDSKSLAIVQALDSATEDDWNAFKDEVIRALSSPREAIQARFELKKATQRVDETVAQFGERLRELGRLGYRSDNQAAMESALIDALSGGVLRDEISIVLIGNSDDTFAKNLEVAVKLDCAYRARSTLKESDDITVSVLKNVRIPAQDTANHDSFLPPHHIQRPQLYADDQYPNHPHQYLTAHQPASYHEQSPIRSNQPQRSYNDNLTENGYSGRPTVICYGCQRPGHYIIDCPLKDPRSSPPNRNHRNFSCHYCGMAGHIIRNCRNRISDLSRFQSQRGYRSETEFRGYPGQGNHTRPELSETNVRNYASNQDARVHFDEAQLPGQLPPDSPTNHCTNPHLPYNGINAYSDYGPVSYNQSPVQEWNCNTQDAASNSRFYSKTTSTVPKN